MISESNTTVSQLPHTRWSRAIDRLLQKFEHGLGWIWLLLMLVVVSNVALRYLFGEGRIEFEEIQWHLYATGFLFGLATCLNSDDHVRVDLFHARLSLRRQAWIELYGLLLLFAPFVVLVLVYAVPFFLTSWANQEVSAAPGGLPARWLIKGTLALSMGVLLLAGLGRLLRVCQCLFGRRPPEQAGAQASSRP